MEHGLSGPRMDAGLQFGTVKTNKQKNDGDLMETVLVLEHGGVGSLSDRMVD